MNKKIEIIVDIVSPNASMQTKNVLKDVEKETKSTNQRLSDEARKVSNETKRLAKEEEQFQKEINRRLLADHKTLVNTELAEEKRVDMERKRFLKSLEQARKSPGGNGGDFFSTLLGGTSIGGIIGAGSIAGDSK